MSIRATKPWEGSSLTPITDKFSTVTAQMEINELFAPEITYLKKN